MGNHERKSTRKDIKLTWGRMQKAFVGADEAASRQQSNMYWLRGLRKTAANAPDQGALMHWEFCYVSLLLGVFKLQMPMAEPRQKPWQCSEGARGILAESLIWLDSNILDEDTALLNGAELSNRLSGPVATWWVALSLRNETRLIWLAPFRAFVSSYIIRLAVACQQLWSQVSLKFNFGIIKLKSRNI